MATVVATVTAGELHAPPPPGRAAWRGWSAGVVGGGWRARLPPEAESLGDGGQAVRDGLGRVGARAQGEGTLHELLERTAEAKGSAALRVLLRLDAVGLGLG